MQLQNPPCTAQVAGHTSDKSHPARLRETSTTILAAHDLVFKLQQLGQLRNNQLLFVKFNFLLFKKDLINALIKK